MIFLQRFSGWAYVTAVLASVFVLIVDAASAGPVRIFLGTIGFVFAVLAAAALGGWRPGLLATVTSLAGYTIFFLEPHYTFRITNPSDFLVLSVYVVTGAAISFLCEGLHFAGGRLRDRQRRLENEILEHRQAELALRKAEARATTESERSHQTAEFFRVTLASIGDGVATTDVQGQVTFLNAVAERLTGWSEAEARGRPLSDVFRIVNERTRMPVDNPCDKVFATGAIVGLANHTLLISKAGNEIPIDDSAAPICDESGKVLGVVLVFRDATHERVAAENLQRLGAIVEYSHDAVIGESLDGTITSWNAAAEKLYGFSATEAIGRPISMVVPSDRQEELTDIMNRLRQGKPVTHLETVRVRKDGTRVDVSLAVSPIKNSDGEVIGASKVARDISESKRVREAVERSEKHLNDFFENSAIGLHWVGPDGTILRANQAELDLLGYAKEEYIGHNIAEFHADQAVIDDILACLKRLESIQSYEARLCCKDGSIKHVLIDSNVYTENGEFIHTRCFTRDITDRRRLEDNLHFLVDASESLVAVVDVQSSMQNLTRRAVAAFCDWCVVHLVSDNGEVRQLAHAHVDPKGESILRELFQRYPLDWKSRSPSADLLRAAQTQVVEDIAPLYFGDAYLDENQRQLLQKLRMRSCLVVPLNSRRRVIGVLTFARCESKPRFTPDDAQIGEDLAKRAVTAIENWRLYEELKVADRQKDDFLAMLAHELRNPLAAISYSRQLLEAAPEHTESAVEIIGRQVTQLSNLINDLLDVSRITRGIIQLKRESIDARTLVDRALGTTRPLIDQLGHTITRQIEDRELPLFVDPTRVEQVLVNLISNAAKFTPNEGRVTVSACSQEDHVIIQVKDTGIGIPQEMLPRVFDMFTQVNPSIDRSKGGLGIGLTVVRRLVEMHDGTVSAFSAGLGKGSEFTIRLPLSTLQPLQTDSPGKSTGVRSGLRVLIVDDNVDTARSLTLLLQGAGCITETAFDGLTALDVAQQFRPHVAVLDIGLPGLDGYELARRIRAHAELPQPRLIALSGYGQERDRSRAVEAGFDHHLVKPVDYESLMSVLSD